MTIQLHPIDEWDWEIRGAMLGHISTKKLKENVGHYKSNSKTLFFLLVAIRTYVIHMFGTNVTILCNWLNLWQNALYLYLGRSRMCLMLQETRFQVQVLKPCKSIQESSVKVLLIKSQQLAWQLASIEA